MRCWGSSASAWVRVLYRAMLLFLDDLLEESALLLDTMAKDEPSAEQAPFLAKIVNVFACWRALLLQHIALAPCSQAAPEDAADLLGELAVDQPLEQETTARHRYEIGQG